MTSDRIAALRRTALFGSLGDEELRALAARSIERKLAREETLFVAGEAKSCVVKGWRGTCEVYAVKGKNRKKEPFVHD